MNGLFQINHSLKIIINSFHQSIKGIKDRPTYLSENELLEDEMVIVFSRW